MAQAPSDVEKLVEHELAGWGARLANSKLASELKCFEVELLESEEGTNNSSYFQFLSSLHFAPKFFRSPPASGFSPDSCVKFSLKREDLALLIRKEVSPQMLFRSSRLRVEGNEVLSMRLSALLKM